MLRLKIKPLVRKLLLVNSWLEPIQTWWSARQLREKVFIGIGTIVAIILLIYELAISPFYTALNNIKAKKNTQQQLVQTLNQLNQTIQQYKQAGISIPGSSDQGLLVTINNSAHERKLYRFVKKISQTDNNNVTVQFDNVPFDLMMQWLTTLWQKYGIAVNQLELIPLKTIGLVKTTLVLQ